MQRCRVTRYKRLTERPKAIKESITEGGANDLFYTSFLVVFGLHFGVSFNHFLLLYIVGFFYA